MKTNLLPLLLSVAVLVGCGSSGGNGNDEDGRTSVLTVVTPTEPSEPPASVIAETVSMTSPVKQIGSPIPGHLYEIPLPE